MGRRTVVSLGKGQEGGGLARPSWYGRELGMCTGVRCGAGVLDGWYAHMLCWVKSGKGLRTLQAVGWRVERFIKVQAGCFRRRTCSLHIEGLAGLSSADLGT